jgi:hypothetical protein
VTESSQRQEAAKVGRDHDGAARDPVGDEPGDRGEQEEREEAQRAEHADLERSPVEKDDREGRQREQRDLVAEVADGLPEPQAVEIGMPTECHVDALF